MEGLLNDTSMFTNFRGKGIGKGLAKGAPAIKGNGKGKAGGKGFLAILDLPPQKEPAEKTPEKLLEEALTKAKKMKDLAANTASSMEEQIKLTKKSKFWSRVAQKEAEENLEKVNEAHAVLKKFLQRQNITDIDLVKGRIMECGLVVKVAVSQIREYKQLLLKASSVAGSTKSKKK